LILFPLSPLKYKPEQKVLEIYFQNISQISPLSSTFTCCIECCNNFIINFFYSFFYFFIFYPNNCQRNLLNV
jgi:hypothetical protein